MSTPLLRASNVTVRALQPEDAESLFDLLRTQPVGQFLLPPPSSAERFVQFIDWAREEQEAGRYLCFALAPPGSERAVGMIQVRRLAPMFATAEWGFAVGQPYWGTGLFVSAAVLVVTYLFETVGVQRLEARTVVTNGRATGVLKKLGANREGLLRQGFRDGDRCFDQVLWSILANEWNASPVPIEGRRTTVIPFEPKRSGAPSSAVEKRVKSLGTEPPTASVRAASGKRCEIPRLQVANLRKRLSKNVGS